MKSIESIEVKGFKSIREMSLELRQLNVLIGANGAGKSNFISVFKLLNQIAERRLQTHVRLAHESAEKILHFGSKATSAINIRFSSFADFQNVSSDKQMTADELVEYNATLMPSAEGNLFFSLEWLKDIYRHIYFQGKIISKEENKTTLHGEGHKETRLPGEAMYLGERIQQKMLGFRTYHFADTSRSAKLRGVNQINDNAYFREDGENLAAWLFLIKEKHAKWYERIVQTIRLVAPFFSDFVLRPDSLNPDTIRLEWKHVSSDEYYTASSLSDGTLRFICLTTLLLQPNLPSNPSSLIIIDEPELGLHPAAINLLAAMLQSASVTAQIIVSTQSVSLVNQFQPEDIIVVDRDDNQSTFRRLNTEKLKDWLQDYSLGELWEMNVFGGRP